MADSRNNHPGIKIIHHHIMQRLLNESDSFNNHFNNLIVLKQPTDSAMKQMLKML
jgi:hypothetical protein